ncbi:putative metal-binding motif-containing protein [Patescibacteria group bacterium]
MNDQKLHQPPTPPPAAPPAGNVPPAPPSATPPPTSPSGGTPQGGLSKQWLIIIIVIVVVVAAGIAGWLYWYNNVRTVPTMIMPANTDTSGGVTGSKTETPKTTPTPTTTPQPTTTPDDTTLDHDRDGYSPAEGDCDDFDITINPGAVEICDDGIDNNCDGYIDEGCDWSGGTDNFDPAVFDYTPYYIYSDEEVYDWTINDSDFDGENEVMVVTYSPSNDLYHAFIVDWDQAFASYMLEYETTFGPPFAYVTTNDWDGDGWADFVIAFVGSSGDGMAVIYDVTLDIYEEMYSSV